MAAVLIILTAVHACDSDLQCSLNGHCANSVCECIKPWSGPSCGVLKYKMNQSISSKNLYPYNDTDAPTSGPCVTSNHTCDALNTWNGPIVGPIDGKYHMFNPLYRKGSLLTTSEMMHGVANSIVGPYKWTSMGIDYGSNPAFVTYPGPTPNSEWYSLWVGGHIYGADNIDGPFNIIGSYPDGNPAPVFHKGRFYLTSQRTQEVLTATPPEFKWTTYGKITPRSVATREDPFMWIDKRGNWHIINHVYDVKQTDHCGSSHLSDHLFSEDGKNWHILSSNVEPYTHTVHYEDGTSHTYTTLERPNLHFDKNGTLTHINLAADLMTQDAGCADYDVCPAKRNGKCACTNCKYADHAGTIIIALEV